LGRGRSQREPNLGNRVDVPTIHSADPLILTLPKHFCGEVHCPDERRFFSFANQVFSCEFFHLVWLKDWNNIPRLLFYSLQDNKQNAFSIPKHRCYPLMELTVSSLALNN
jgi:hypothetical protein